MSGPRCARSWEAEAIEDGQLNHADRASFERHAATCVSCAREASALASLRRTMREFAAPEPTAMELRRARSGLLQQAHALQTRGRQTERPRWLVVAVLCATTSLVLVAGVHFRARRSAQSSPVGALPGAGFEIVDVAGAAVTSRDEGGLTRAALSDGTAGFHVEHLAPGRRFLLVLPDGELEVRGTRFVVDVRSASTRRVEVTEGVVALRLIGESERVLVAGETWIAAPRASATAASVAAPEPAAGASTDAEHHAPSSHRADARKAAGPSPVASSSDAHVAANESFALAIDAFGAADYARADSLLASFLRDFAGDARAEDASFLRAVAHARMGDAPGATALAKAYLARFPQGFRRPEAEGLAYPASSGHGHPQ